MNAKLTIDGEEWPGDYHAGIMSARGDEPGHLVVRSTTPCSRDLIVGWHRWIGAGPGHRFVLLREGGELVEGRARWRSYNVGPWGEDPQFFEYRVEFGVV